jgi:beta-1,4-N-acetylglucosaminyltransferase
MIFVTTGTNEAPFDRLVHASGLLTGRQAIVVQRGSSALQPRGVLCVDFLPFAELVKFIRRARVVVTHAGVGSVMVALANGKRPIVVPRLRRFGEAVDDHQVPLALRLQREGLVTVVEDPAQLPEALAREGEHVAQVVSGGSALARDLGAYLASNLRAPRPTSSRSQR